MAAANAQIGVAQADFYPSARLFAGGGIDISFAGGIALAQFIFDGGLREATKAQATAAYEETVANYRQTVLGALRDVEDNLAAERILEEEATVQGAAVKASRDSVTITNNQYRAGTVTYLAVVVVQAGALANERAELAVLGRRLVASVNLIKAIGGGWEAPPAEDRGHREVIAPIDRAARRPRGDWPTRASGRRSRQRLPKPPSVVGNEASAVERIRAHGDAQAPAGFAAPDADRDDRSRIDRRACRSPRPTGRRSRGSGRSRRRDTWPRKSARGRAA